MTTSFVWKAVLGSGGRFGNRRSNSSFLMIPALKAASAKCKGFHSPLDDAPGFDIVQADWAAFQCGVACLAHVPVEIPSHPALKQTTDDLPVGVHWSSTPRHPFP